MRFLKILMVALAACCPDPNGATLRDPHPRAEDAIEAVGEIMSEYVGYHVDVVIYWSSTTIDGETRKGWASACDNIWIYWNGISPIPDTSLAHEMGHCYSGDIPEDSCWFTDNSHSDERWWGSGGLVELANARIRELGL